MGGGDPKFFRFSGKNLRKTISTLKIHHNSLRTLLYIAFKKSEVSRYIVDILSHFCDISTIYYEIYRKNEIIYRRYIAIYRRYIKIYRKKLFFLRYIAYITLFLYFDISYYIEFRYIRKFSLIYLEIYENLIYIDISFDGILYHFMKLIDIFP